MANMQEDMLLKVDAAHLAAMAGKRAAWRLPLRMATWGMTPRR